MQWFSELRSTKEKSSQFVLCLKIICSNNLRRIRLSKVMLMWSKLLWLSASSLFMCFGLSGTSSHNAISERAGLAPADRSQFQVPAQCFRQSSTPHLGGSGGGYCDASDWGTFSSYFLPIPPQLLLPFQRLRNTSRPSPSGGAAPRLTAMVPPPPPPAAARRLRCRSRPVLLAPLLFDNET